MSSTHGFTLVREQDVPELRTHARLLRHDKTGAELLSLENDDENKAFGVAFRTPTSDSTGVPHILEHSVLGGSRKFPVREPFNELAKGSLHTFLNAMTSADRTLYPIASTNLQDFYNLADVYLDAVFHPRISPETFEQEGWRYEVVDGQLVYKGVVLNEMRGAYASPDRVLGEQIFQSLFPDASYRFSSGGDPRHIPDLSYEQFCAFHRRYYHPSNARLYFYGDDDPRRRLELVDGYLRDFERLEVGSDVRLQPRFDAPRRVTSTFAVGPETARGKQARVAVTWLLPEIPDREEGLLLRILADILVDVAASPLRKALIDSGLGEALAASGLGTSQRQWTFGAGLRGIDPARAGEVEELIFTTLRRLAEDGIDPDTVAAALHTVEFQLRENNTGRFPRGLSLFSRALGAWTYDRDPITALAFEQPLAAIKRRLADGERAFEQRIQSYLLDNPHRSTVLLLPDPQQGPRELAEERARLAGVAAGLTPAQMEAIDRRAQTLRRFQETPDTPEALATIPRLQRSDLEKQHKPIPVAGETRQGVPVLFHDLFTGGIVYLDLAFDLRALPADLLPYVGLFGRALTGLGTRRQDFVALSERIRSQTGGLRVQPFTTTTARADGGRAGGEGAGWLALRGKALTGQAGALLDILRDVILDAQLDNQERFRQLARESKAGLEAGVVRNGTGVVAQRVAARFSGAEAAAERLSGVDTLLFLRELVEGVERDWPAVLAALEEIRRALLTRPAAICNVTTGADAWTGMAPALDGFLATLPAGAAARTIWQPRGDQQAEAMVVPGQVNFVAKAGDLYQAGYAYHGSVVVIAHYLRRTWLHEQVRLRGGAYGVGASFNRLSGVFTYSSYRDPSILGTLAAYDGSPRYLRELDLSEDELTRAIIGAIGNVDPYLLPDAKGWVSLLRHLTGESDAALQRRRDEILATTIGDFHAFGDLLETVRAGGQVAILGNEPAIQAAAAERPGWLNVWSLGL